jgi:hypothetical protein
MSIKEINQNPERYTNEGAQWKISASKDIKPIYLPIGLPLKNLKPVIKGNGIIVKIGLDYLCSQQTLKDIKDSKNPHYDIVENGKIKVKDKEVGMGKTIKIIELDVTKLQGIITGRDLQNRQAGVVDISYIDDIQNGVVEGIPIKLIEQINYTLDTESIRPSDKFEVVDYQKMVDKTISPHYAVIPLITVTDQEKTIFDPLKLQTLKDIKDSKNPHYDIVENGKLTIKDKVVSMGKTIKIIELDVTKLQGMITGRDFQNRQAGVVDVSYIDDAQNGLVEGIPIKLIDQINYTLDKVSGRPSDKFEVVDYEKMVDKELNPHYTFVPITTITNQEKTIFDPLKLQTFLIELDKQLDLLRKDFNRIKGTFFDGEIPTPNIYGIIQKDLIAESDSDEDNHSVKKTESSTLISVESNPINTIKDSVEKAKKDLEDDIAKTNDEVKRRVEEQRKTIEEKIQQGQTNDSQNQSYLATKIVELQQQIKKLQTK